MKRKNVLSMILACTLLTQGCFAVPVFSAPIQVATSSESGYDEDEPADYNASAIQSRNETTGLTKDEENSLEAEAINAAGNTSSSSSSSGSVQQKLNEKKIFEFMVKELGLNNAAATGVLANIKAESSFRTDALGDGGTSYGICQWHNGRWSNLKKYCPDSWKTLEGQLRFLKMELQTGYVKTLKALQSVSNNTAGAYKAAYYWCVLFEMPDHKQQRGRTRGEIAVTQFWPTYRTYKPEQ